MKNWKQILAAVGAAALLVSNLGSVSQVVYAEESELSESVDKSEKTELKAEEPKAEEPKVEEPKAEEPKAEEPKIEEPKAEEPKAEEPKAEEPKVEEPKAEEPKAEKPKVEEPKAEEPKVEEPKTEAVVQNDAIIIGGTEDTKWTEDDTTITIENNIPDGGKIAVESKDKDSVTISDKTVIAVYDISILVDDDETQPDGEVTVTIKDNDLTDGNKVNVYHYADNSDKADLIKSNATVSNNSVSFTTSSFSVFALTDGTEIDSIELSDNIKNDGTLVATFKDSNGKDVTDAVIAAAKNGELTITWAGGNNSTGAVDAETPNKLNVVKDHGAQLTYTVSVGDVTSNNLKVDYYDSFQNGGFEDYKISSSYLIKEGGISGWKTNAPKSKMELGRYDGNAHGAVGDKLNDSVGEQYAELNANDAATLYQDVLTDGGSKLTWSLLHRATTFTTKADRTDTDPMYAVIMSTEDADKILNSVLGNNKEWTSALCSQAQNVLETMLNSVLNGANQVTDAKYTLDGVGEVNVTAWYIRTATKQINNNGTMSYSCETKGYPGTSSTESGWASYTGTYTVPEGQYLTRFFFVSAATNAESGNLLDNVEFDQKVAYTIEYWLWNPEDKVYEIQDKSTTTGRQYPNQDVDADTSKYGDNYAFVGSTQGTASGGENPTSLGTATTFAVSGSNNVLSLYYMASASGSITWSGDEDVYTTTRPAKDNLKITTTVNGKEHKATVSVDKSGNWTYTFDDLPKYNTETGEVITYTITTSVEHYTASTKGTDITYTYNDKTSISGKLTWVDGENADSKRPTSAEITVTGSDGKTYNQTITPDKDGNWTYTIENLPKKDNSTGKEITYKLTSVDPGTGTEYVVSIDDNNKDATLTKSGKTTATGTLTWVDNNNADGTRPKKAIVKVTGSDGKVHTVEVTVPADSDELNYELTDLPKYDGNGKAITYTLTSVTVNDAEYTVSIDKNGEDATLKKSADTTFSGELNWIDGNNTDGTRPETATVKVTGSDGKVHTVEVTVPTNNNKVTYNLSNLPKYDENGKAITYTLTAVVTGDDEYVVTKNTNKKDATLKRSAKRTVSGKLTWVDDNNAEKDRPETVIVKITGTDGNIYEQEITADKDGNWTYSIDDLPKYDNNGKTITYKMTVDPGDGTEYSVSLDDNDTDATLTKEANTDIVGTITWIDGNNAEETRPESLTITVKGDNGDEHTEIITPNENGEWSYAVDRLPKYTKSGKRIRYSLVKFSTGNNDYEVEVDNTNATCTLEGETDFTGTIKWNDQDNNDGKRPENVTVNVYDGNGELVASKVVSEENEWDYSFENLPKYDKNGNRIVYSLTATTVDGYTSAITGSADEGFVVTNSYEPMKADISGVITWDDDSDSDGKRPESITIEICDENGDVVATKTITADGGWAYTIDGLPRYKDGKEIQYTIKAVDTDGYEMTIDGTNVTYKHEVEKSNGGSGSGKHNGGGYANVDFYLVDDATTKSLASGKVGLYTSAGELIGVYTTDANGHIAFPNLKGGSYYLEQITAPDGYRLNTNRLNFTVDGTPLGLMLADKAAGATVDQAAIDAANAAAANAATGAGDGQGAAGAGNGNAAAVSGATGDESNMMIYGAVAASAAAMLALWFVLNRRNIGR